MSFIKSQIKNNAIEIKQGIFLLGLFLGVHKK